METKARDWQGWLREHTSRLLLFARAQTRCEADAEDVLQDALVECWRRSKGATPELPLVYATLRRRAIDLARSTDRRVAREETVVADIETVCWFDDALTKAEAASILDRAMKKMPEKFREVMLLKIWGGLTFVQVAETLDIPMNTAASRYRYGLAFLRKDTELSQS
ncbi:MAG: sigma-70 family RNA polymerase sigma factor [Verrucomicrobiota bacterium]|nr:sigma-70 family RNA polymerase sigma factor [Verrucomicrobiota bacterium]